MKFLLLGMALFSSVTSFAADAMTSQALSGEYQLVKASSKWAQQYHCPEEIQISVDQKVVVLETLKGIYAHDSFWSDNSGCKKTTGDTGPVRKTCTRFSETSVAHSITEPLGVAGYASESKKVELKRGNNKLIYSNNITLIPFGILGINKDKEFKCTYERL